MIDGLSKAAAEDDSGRRHTQTDTKGERGKKKFLLLASKDTEPQTRREKGLEMASVSFLKKSPTYVIPTFFIKKTSRENV